MKSIRVLHVDDEPDIREVVELSLGLDPAFVVCSCASGAEALMVAPEWLPDIILLDVMMPLMDGPTALAWLRDNPKTAGIPVIFMTARAQTLELDHFHSLGVVGVIPKPFHAMTLAASVRSHVKAHDPLESLRVGFLLRLKKDAARLAVLRPALSGGTDTAGAMAAIRQIAHGLAGAGGIFGFAEISDAAAALEDAVIAETASPDLGGPIGYALEHLISLSESDGASRPENVALLRNA
jgi:CheY-like chemotaxis protein